MKFAVFAILVVAYIGVGEALHCVGECQHADNHALMNKVRKIKEKQFKTCYEDGICGQKHQSISNEPCVGGKAGEYECNNVDLLAYVSLSDLGCSGSGNDIWGWTDPETKKEYAICGCADGTSFVDVTEPTEPKVLGFMRTYTVSSSWRDMKVYQNHAFIVSEASNHGMQVFDLTRLRDLTGNEVEQLEPDAHYSEMTSTHNIVGNEDTGFMYAVGTRTCNSGLHMIDVNDPKNPQFAGCFGSDGYVHDAQCVVYKGADTKYQGREICFCYNENTLTIVDVEDKANPTMLSRVPYNNAYYTHQGWLTEDQSHLLLNDELDELYGPTPNTRSLVWNVEQLEDPKLTGSFFSEKRASDHNLYIKGNLAYETNYCAGLRVLDVEDLRGDAPNIKELGYFDVAPYCDAPGFMGSWSNYPYFESETIIVQSIERGLYVLKYTGPTTKSANGTIEHNKL